MLKLNPPRADSFGDEVARGEKGNTCMHKVAMKFAQVQQHSPPKEGVGELKRRSEIAVPERRSRKREKRGAFNPYRLGEQRRVGI